MARVMLDVTVGDDGDLSFTLDADGVTEDEIVPVLLSAIETHVSGAIRETVVEQLPFAADSLIDPIVMNSARLTVLHEVMHLPAATGDTVHIDH